MAYNNEKILNLLKSKDTLEPHIDEYLSKLKDNMVKNNEQSSKYSIARKNLHKVNAELMRIAKREDKKSKAFLGLVSRIKKEAQKKNEELQDVVGKSEKGLEELIDLKSESLSSDYALQMSSYLRKNVSDINISRLINLLEMTEKYPLGNEDYKNQIHKINADLDNVIGANMRGFKSFMDNKQLDTLKAELEPAFSRISKLGLNDQARKIKQILSNLDSFRIFEQPDSSEIVEIIHSTRNPAMYISRGYTVLEYVKPVYADMTYLQRAFRDNRKYEGTKNAWNRYLNSVSNLDEYYKGHYQQAGGSPKNLHGHHAGEHE